MRNRGISAFLVFVMFLVNCFPAYAEDGLSSEVPESVPAVLEVSGAGSEEVAEEPAYVPEIVEPAVGPSQEADVSQESGNVQESPEPGIVPTEETDGQTEPAEATEEPFVTEPPHTDSGEETTQAPPETVQPPEETAGPEQTVEPDPTSQPEQTQIADPTSQPEQTVEPDPGHQTAEPDLPSPTDAAEETEVPVATVEPAPSDTPEPVEADMETETYEVTDDPSQTQEPETEDEYGETLDTEDELWDESQCDHANEHCIQAPHCGTEGCVHIRQDVHGLDVPVCPLGRWLLDRQDALSLAQSGTRSVQGVTSIDLTQGDAVLYRSGVYLLENSSAITGNVEIAPNRIVILRMEKTSMNTLRLHAGSQATVYTRGQNELAGIMLETGTRLTLSGSGTGHIRAVSLSGEKAPEVFIPGGSWQVMGIRESAGRVLEVFEAQGAVRATLDGEALDYTGPDRDGKAYLYLPAPKNGVQYTGSVQGDTLVIASQAVPTAVPVVTPEPDPEPVPTQDRVVCQAGETYNVLSGDSRVYVIEADQVTLCLNGADLRAEQIEASVPYRLRVDAASHITGDLTYAAIEADELLTLDGRTDDTVQFVSGSIHMNAIPSGWNVFPVRYDTERIEEVIVDGERIPCMMLLPALELLVPQTEAQYLMSLQGAVLMLTSVREGQTFSQHIFESRLELSLEQFTVQGEGTGAEGSLTLRDAHSQVHFHNVQVHNDGPVLVLAKEQLEAVFTGDNALISLSQVISEEESSVTLSAMSGRLLMQQQDLLPGMTLKGNIKIVPEPEAAHVTLCVINRTGQRVANTPVTVRIGDTVYDWVTHYDGTLSLWGIDYDGDVAISDGHEIYRAVIQNAQAEVAPELNIEDIRTEDHADGTMTIRFTCEGALTSGVSYIVAQQERDLPDTFVERAGLAYAQDGQVRLSDIEPGMTVSLRVFATRAENAVLTPSTADGFSFSEIVRHVHRGPFTVTDSLDRTYTGRPYVCPVRLPQNAKVHYTGKDLNADGLPVQVGTYHLVLTMPENDPVYLPGETSFPFQIRKIRLVVEPEPNQEKYPGEEDPEFFFSVTGLLEEDEVEGVLLREEGEEPGNYAFDVSGLEAAEYYVFVLADDAPVFTILPDMDFWDEEMAFDLPFIFTGEILHPVRQDIVRTDGRKLSVMLQATDNLQLGSGNVGRLVFDTRPNQNQLFTPSMKWDEENQQLLLRLRTEPEINKDKGYATDADGNLLWGGRYLRLNWQALEYLQKVGVDAVSLVHAGASLTVPVKDLLSQDMQQFSHDHNWTLSQTTYRLVIIPSTQVPDSILSKRPVTDGWTMGLYVGNGQQHVDITEDLHAIAAVDLEPVARLMNSVGRYDAMTFGEGLDLLGSMEENALPSTYIQPATPEESTSPYKGLMFNHRYLFTRLPVNDTLYCVNSKK